MPALNTPGRHRGQDGSNYPNLRVCCVGRDGETVNDGKFAWLRQIREMPLNPYVTLVAHVLADFASKDGKSSHPGVQRIMWASGIKDRKTVNRALGQLRGLGLIYLVEVGGGRHKDGRATSRADEYWLTLHDQLDELKVSYEDWLKTTTAPRS